MRVQKYVDERGIDIIRNLRLLASDPTTFNDPFELSMGIRKQTDNEFINYLKSEETRGEMLKANPQMSEKEVYNYFSEKLEDHEWIKKFNNKKHELDVAHLKKARTRVGMVTRVICFSINENTEEDFKSDILMWSHYTNKHSGLKFHFEESKFPEDIQGFKVEYRDERPLNTASGEEFLKGLCIVKSSAWGYEKECRWLLTKEKCDVYDGANSYINIPPESIVRVDIGINSSDELKKELFSLLQKADLSHVEVYQAEIHPTLYKIEYKRINPPFPLL
ncbi:MAG: DUF2971 domain-containing protein [Candidatus Auribacterota bacterium]